MTVFDKTKKTLQDLGVSDAKGVESLFAELQKHLKPAQMVELTSAIAWENYRARFDHAFGIEAEGFSAGAVCALPAHDHQAVSGGRA